MERYKSPSPIEHYLKPKLMEFEKELGKIQGDLGKYLRPVVRYTKQKIETPLKFSNVL